MRKLINISTLFHLKVVIGVFALCAASLSLSQPEPLAFTIPSLEGAQHKPTYVLKLTQWLATKHCIVNINKHPQDPSQNPKPALVFNVLPGKSLEALPIPPGYRIVAKGDIIDNAPLTLQWLSLRQQNLSHITSLNDERLALLAPPNPIGNLVALNTLQQANVTVNSDKLFYTTSYQGAVALLLHRNVRAAAVVGPLADRWQHSNDLQSLIETPVDFIAVIMIAHNVSEHQHLACTQAFDQLTRTNRRDPLMKLFPEWLTGFHSVTQRQEN